MRENICNQRGTNLQNMQVAHSAQYQSKKKKRPTKSNSIENWAGNLTKPFSKEDMQKAKHTWKDAQHH